MSHLPIWETISAFSSADSGRAKNPPRDRQCAELSLKFFLTCTSSNRFCNYNFRKLLHPNVRCSTMTFLIAYLFKKPNIHPRLVRHLSFGDCAHSILHTESVTADTATHTGAKEKRTSCERFFLAADIPRRYSLSSVKVHCAHKCGWESSAKKQQPRISVHAACALSQNGVSL